MKKMKFWMMSLIAVIFAGTLAVGCAPGGYASVGSGSNTVTVSLDFETYGHVGAKDITNKLFYVWFSEYEQDYPEITNASYYIFGNTGTNFSEPKKVEQKLPDGDYYIYAWVDMDESITNDPPEYLTAGDLERSYVNIWGNPRTLSVWGENEFPVSLPLKEYNP